MYTVPYGKGTIRFSLPPGMRVAQAVSKPVPPIENEKAAVAEALAQPVGAPPLNKIARSGNRVCIVFTDSTRSCPDDLLVPPILAELRMAGVRDEDITLLCGIGMHRPSTHGEKVAKLGADIVSRYRVIDNEPQNPAALVDLGKTAGGVPVSVHRSCRRIGPRHCHRDRRTASVWRVFRRQENPGRRRGGRRTHCLLSRPGFRRSSGNAARAYRRQSLS